MTHPRPRELFDSLKAYKAGASAALDDLKLASNENPYGPLPEVRDAVAAELDRFNRYPDPSAHALYDALATRYGLPEEHFALGAGSVSVLMNLLQVMCQDGDEVLFAWRSFEAYPIAVHLTGARAVRVGLLEDGRHDLDAMAKEFTSATKVVILCSPNNPTGPAIRTDELFDFMAKVPPHVLVIFDEAYTEFVTDPLAARGLSLFTAFNNVALLRTFSKAYGLAGLRVGYTLAPAAIAEAVRKITTPFAVTNLAQIAAVASLKADEELRERVAGITAERERVIGVLKEAGWQIPDSQGNFVWLGLGSQSAQFAAQCEPLGLTVRVFPDEGVRVTIGSPEANDAFLSVAKAGADNWSFDLSE